MSDFGPDDDNGPDAGDNPASVLRGWWRAATVVAAVWMRPPLVLAGPAPAEPARGEIGRAARGFPLVGFAIGAGAGLAFLFARALGLDMAVSAIIAVGLAAYAGGALGESGLARVADALVAGGGRDAVLAAMRQRAHGTYGILVLVLAFMIKVACLAALPGTAAAIAALIAAAVVSRAAIPLLLRTMSPARNQGLAADAGRPSFNETMLTLALGAAVVLLAMGPWVGIIALVVAAAGVFKFYFLADRFVGGVTGAVLGAAQQAAEIGVLLAAAALA